MGRWIIPFIFLLIALKSAELASGQKMAAVAAGILLVIFILYFVVLLGWGYAGVRDSRWGAHWAWWEERRKHLRWGKRRSRSREN